MLTLRHPEIIEFLKDFPGGLYPIRDPRSLKPFLIIKTNKEAILTAKIKQGFRFYIVPTEEENAMCCGIITAFMDDPDQPLTISSPLFSDPMSELLVEILSEEQFNVHFFDENNRELLGYCANNPTFSRFHQQSPPLQFASFSYEAALSHLNRLQDWFGLRNLNDDAAAAPVQFKEPLFPEETCIFNLDPASNSHHGKKISPPPL